MTYFRSSGYEIVKLFVTQFVMGIYGIVVIMSVLKYGTVSLLVGIASVILYYFLIYTQMWDIGGKDRIRVDAGHDTRDFIKPVAMGVFANLPNFILATVEIVAYFVAPDSALYAIPHAATHFIQSFYIGITKYFGLLNNPFVYAITPLLSVFVIVFAYMFGYHGLYLTPISKKLRERRSKKF